MVCFTSSSFFCAAWIYGVFRDYLKDGARLFIQYLGLHWHYGIAWLLK